MEKCMEKTMFMGDKHDYAPEFPRQIARHMVSLLEELDETVSRLDVLVPDCRNTQSYSAWLSRKVQAEQLWSHAESWLECCLNEIKTKNAAWGSEAHSGLREPEDYLFYRCLYGEFPENMEVFEIQSVKSEISDRIAELAAQEPCEFDEPEEFVLRTFRMERYRKQIGELDQMLGRWIPEDDDRVNVPVEDEAAIDTSDVLWLEADAADCHMTLDELLQEEQKLKARLEELEKAEYDFENEPYMYALWQQRMETLQDRLENVQTAMWDLALEGEEWDPLEAEV